MFKGFGDFTTVSTSVEGMFDPEGNAQKLKLRALTRTYIQKYQGTPKKVLFEADSGDFAYWFTYNPEINKPSVLYYHEQEFYPNGFKITALIDESTPVKVHTQIIQKNYLEVILDSK